MWEISAVLQIQSFIYSIILGAIFSLIYDFFRTYRNIKTHSSITVFLEDIFYFFIISIITFIFLLSTTNGEIRFYILFGILFGFIIFHIFFSKYILRCLLYLFNKIKRFLILIKKLIYRFFNKIDYYSMIFLKFILKCFKKVLKTVTKLLYTNRK